MDKPSDLAAPEKPLRIDDTGNKIKLNDYELAKKLDPHIFVFVTNLTYYFGPTYPMENIHERSRS